MLATPLIDLLKKTYTCRPLTKLAVDMLLILSAIGTVADGFARNAAVVSSETRQKRTLL